MDSEFEILKSIYTEFNDRNVDSVLRRMDPEVDWPNVLEGTVIHGKEELKAYWQKQWKESDPQVDPVQIKDMGAHTYDVTVHQVVKDLTGKVLVDQQVHHIYSFVGGQVRKMEIRKTE